MNNPHTQVPPLFRQAFVVAGTMVLAGSAMAYFSNPLWFILPVLVGSGLLISALLGFCPMVFILQQLPWNKK